MTMGKLLNDFLKYLKNTPKEKVEKTWDSTKDLDNIDNAAYFKPTKNCYQGWYLGECCCNCKFQIDLHKHPWNKTHKGSISESSGLYACTAFKDLYGEDNVILFENMHGFCELHQPKK